jgi:vacuolar-type H+-ATPase subunit C/Vma6
VAVTSVHSYALVQATVRPLYAELLSRPAWESLIEATDYEAMLSLLNETIYAPYIQLQQQALTPRRLVYQIRWHLADVYAKLIRIMSDPGASLLEVLWHHYEVDNIKVALRGIDRGATWQQVLHLLYPMKKYIRADTGDLEQMVSAGDVVRAIEVLRGTDYYRILSHAIPRYQAENSLFPVEVALDLGYRRMLWDRIYDLKGTDRKMALETVGTVLDTDNLLWAIRYRLYHRLSPAEIINYTLPMGYEVHDNDIQAIARGADIADVVFRLYPQLRPKLEGVDFDSGEGLEKLEQAFLEMLLERCHRMFVGSPFHIGLPLAYVWLNEYEIRDLTVVIEAKASGTQPEAFRPMLIMPYLDSARTEPRTR